MRWAGLEIRNQVGAETGAGVANHRCLVGERRRKKVERVSESEGADEGGGGWMTDDSLHHTGTVAANGKVCNNAA